MPITVIPITESIDIETQSVVAVASTPDKAKAMIKALTARNPTHKYYAEDALTLDTIEF